LLCFICGSRSPEAFLVELGAAISVVSTTVPARSSRPLACSSGLAELLDIALDLLGFAEIHANGLDEFFQRGLLGQKMRRE